MATFNMSSFNPDFFILLGLSGLERFYTWMGIPFFIIYLMAFAGNTMLVYLVFTEHSLHEPMFFLLSLLATMDLVLCNTCVPKTLSIFWRGPQEITFSGCLTQMFFLHFSFAMDSAILLTMAFDRYVAICLPLRYATILTHQMVAKIMVAVVSRSFAIISPCVFLLKRLPFCRTRIVPHTYCEHIGIARLACADISINKWYGFAVPIMTIMSDLLLIGVSYTLILRAVFNLPSQDARQKALSTCGSHICVILIFYIPCGFSVFAHRFGHNIPHNFHILFANLYVALPPAINPVIYGMRTKQIRDKIKLLFPKENQ